MGRYANTPYTVNNTKIRIWCLEELCYYICENAELIDDSFVGVRLIDWLKDECGLADLSSRLRIIRRQSIKTENLVEEILKEADYVTEEEFREIRRVIRSGRSLDPSQRSLVLADHFLKGGSFSRALEIYEGLSLSIELDDTRKAYVFHNMGVIYARLFYFKEAAMYFEKAYELGGALDSAFCRMAAKRMELSDSEYLKLVTALPEGDETPAAVERAMESVKREYADSPGFKKEKDALALRNTGRTQEYDEAAARMIADEMDVYRHFMPE